VTGTVADGGVCVADRAILGGEGVSGEVPAMCAILTVECAAGGSHSQRAFAGAAGNADGQQHQTKP
jgi:hypothetical protein